MSTPITPSQSGGAYRQARPGDDLTHAIYRDTTRGPEPWVPAEPLGWQVEGPEWARRLHDALTSPEVSWWFDAEGLIDLTADGLEALADRLRRVSAYCRDAGRAAQRRRGVRR